MAQFFQPDTVFTVSNLTSLVREILEGTFSNITLEGEISNFKPNSTGHLYFTLKDEGAQISAVMFRGKAAYLNFIPKDGMKVRCSGSVSVYAPRGNYQIIISKMEMSGQGNILQIIEERKRKLAAEGLFDSSRKKKLPVFPKTIGIVTSATGAALRDMLQITKRRNKNINVVILPALVQGDGAASTIAAMIKAANDFNLCDVLIVGRGGGSLEDLLPFSEEIVVRAVANSRIPTVSAVGHETDWSLCDIAADIRAPTPSAAAELVVPELNLIRQDLVSAEQELYSQIKQKVERFRLMIKAFDVNNMEIRFRTIEQPLLNRLEYAKESLLKNISERIKDTRNVIRQSINILEGASPQTILDRGYSMVKTSDGKVIRSGNDVKAGDLIEIIPATGHISATVNEQ